MQNIKDIYIATKNKIKKINIFFEILEYFNFFYVLLSFMLIGPLIHLFEISFEYILFNCILSVLLFVFYAVFNSKLYNYFFKMFIKNIEKITLDKTFVEFKKDDLDYILMRSVLENKNITNEDLIFLIDHLNELDQLSKQLCLLSILKNHQNIISIEKILSNKNDILNDFEIKLVNNFKIKNLILEKNHLFKDNIKIDYLIENFEKLDKETIEIIIFPKLKEKYSIEELTELMFTKKPEKFENDLLKTNVWNYLNGNTTESVFYLKIYIIEEILKNKDETVLLQYKEEFFEKTNELQLSDMNLLYIMKQKLNESIKINVEKKINKVIKI